MKQTRAVAYAEVPKTGYNDCVQVSFACQPRQRRRLGQRQLPMPPNGPTKATDPHTPVRHDNIVRANNIKQGK